MPKQDNNYDCGVFLLRNAFNLVQRVHTKVLMTDINNRLQTYIDNNELFHYDKADINRMRAELFTMYGCLTNVYQHRRVMTQPARLDPLELESDSEEEDEVVIISSYPDRLDTASNEDSDLSWRDDDGADDLGGLDDEDNDHLLIADTTGEFKIKPNFGLLGEIFHHNSRLVLNHLFAYLHLYSVLFLQTTSKSFALDLTLTIRQASTRNLRLPTIVSMRTSSLEM